MPIVNKLASLVATLVRNYDPACDSLTRVKSRATSVAKNISQQESDIFDSQNLENCPLKMYLTDQDLSLIHI